MMIPYPYDWISHWESQHKVKLSKDARQELADHLASIAFPKAA